MTANNSKFCPVCRVPITEGYRDQTGALACPKCGAKLKLEPREPSASNSSKPLTSFLETLENLFIKMIVGVFKFILLKLPTELFNLVQRWFPTLVKSLKVGLLAAIWMVLVLSPVVVVFGWERLVKIGSGAATLPIWFHEYESALRLGSSVYTTLALAGSLWGALTLRRRLKNDRAR